MIANKTEAVIARGLFCTCPINEHARQLAEENARLRAALVALREVNPVLRVKQIGEAGSCARQLQELQIAADDQARAALAAAGK